MLTTALFGANKAVLKLAGTPSNVIWVAFCKFCPIITTYFPACPVKEVSVLRLPVPIRVSLGDGWYNLTLVILGAPALLLSLTFLQAGSKATIIKKSGNKHKRAFKIFFI